MIKYIVLTAQILCLTVLFGCSSSDKPLKQNQSVTLKTTDGKTIMLQKTADGFFYDDKSLLLAFFTTSCIPCNAQIPHLNNLQSRYEDNLNIISVILEDKPLDEIQNFITEKNIDFTTTLDKNNFRLSSTLGNITSVPYMVIYDKAGAYVTDYTGAIPEEMIEADLKRIF
ncbi:MAG: TlpA family protein disulfide reductase [Campylobacteraceae bacterium]|nr:TlpA family protein disulfide reductase [Campylobacteraceae bacterium]